MKSNFFSDIKDKFKVAKETAQDEYDSGEYDFEEYENDEAYEPSEYQPETQEEENISSYSAADEYNFGYDAPTASAPSKRTQTTHSQSSQSSQQRASSRRSSQSQSSARYERFGDTNIYKMNSDIESTRTKISRVVYFNLDDPEDAKNIADCMIKKDCVVLLDITKLSDDDAMKVLNFLDGVRYICKSSIERISNIHLIVPEAIELTGDFYDQMSRGAFNL